MKEFTNIAFLTVKVGLRGAAEWGHGAAGRAAGRQQGGGERRSLLGGGTDTPLLLPVPYREPATWCPRTSPSLPSPCSAASLRMSLSRSCPGCAWCFPAACTRRLPPAWLGLAAAWLCHGTSPWLLAGRGSAWQDGSRGRQRGGGLPAGWGERSPRGSLPAGPCSCLRAVASSLSSCLSLEAVTSLWAGSSPCHFPSALQPLHARCPRRALSQLLPAKHSSGGGCPPGAFCSPEPTLRSQRKVTYSEDNPLPGARSALGTSQ